MGATRRGWAEGRHGQPQPPRSAGASPRRARGSTGGRAALDPSPSPTSPPPQGGIDHLENPLAAAARELKEETGIVSARVVAIGHGWTHYDAPTRVRAPGNPGTDLVYRGQTQKWVLAYFYGDEREIDLGASGEREFSAHAWRPLPDLASSVVPFKRRVYAAVQAEFGPVIEARAGRAGAGWWGRSV
jgi:8-oxo-dGTP pyrophosphatase MutT (NUDIX family)